MKIGIDLDNTIISYDSAFLNVAKTMSLIDQDFQGSKPDVQQIIKQQKDGERIWQKLQGQVYGKFIDQANIFPGFKSGIGSWIAIFAQGRFNGSAAGP